MAQSCVAALVNGMTINRELRLILSHFWVSDMHYLYVTPHYLSVSLPHRKCSIVMNQFETLPTEMKSWTP